ncbi:hypothetical protein BN130_3866 [Cronobacter malonaticus 507]|nr:hypothetical protein BN130_3866 [Cronobacter malonaticus 507]
MAIQHAGVRHRLRHIRQAKHHAVDLARLNALAADFKLIVTASEIFHRAVRQPARHVTGAVHPLAWYKRIGDKAAGGQIRAAKVALGQLNASEIEIARHARRHRAHQTVENAQAGIPHREANRHAGPLHLRKRRAESRIPAHVHRRLRRAVEVMQRHGGEPLPVAAQFSRQRFAATEHLAQRRAGIDRRFIGERADKRRQHRRHKMGRRHPPARKQCLKRLRIAVRLWRCHHQPRADDKRPEKLPYRHIKTARRFLQHDVIRAERILALHPQQPVNDSGLADHDALRPSGGAGGKNHIGGVRRARARERLWIADWQRRVVAEHRQARDMRETPLL